MDYSQITVLGRVQPRDAETRYTAGGSQVLAFRFVVNRKRKNTTGEYEDAADWYQVSCFGKLAEQVANFAVKGQRLLISGRFSTRLWTDNEGREHTSLEIAANDVILLSSQPAPTGDQWTLEKSLKNNPTAEPTEDPNDLPF